MRYPANARGEVRLDADVDGATVHFVVDTGANLVTLTFADAEAAGINPAALAFSMRMSTANGETRAAPVLLRGIRIGQLSLDDVQAVVVRNVPVSLLGMSFLSRLDQWEMRGGVLTISY
jgi:aspartyl protease family protein